MIYQFRCYCSEKRPFLLEIGADARHSFLELHQLLQSALRFHNHQLASFFIPPAQGRKYVEISLHDGPDRPAMLSMRNTPIGRGLHPSVRSFRYVFDLISDRYIQIELTGTIMENNLMEPVVSLQRGENPVQVLDEVMTAELPEVRKSSAADTDFGILTDYYEVFGEMEELVR